MIALIDGDIVAWRCAASCEPTKTRPEKASLDEAIFRTDSFLYRIVNNTGSDEYRIFLTGPSNFRHRIYPSYKAHRKHLPKPEYLGALRDFLVREWGATVCQQYEADDALSIHASNPDTIVCSTDKDTLQIVGQHYNFVREEFLSISPRQAALHLWSQLLVGDRADNHKGIAGIGPAKAERILRDLSPEEMQAVVRGYYESERSFLVSYYVYKLLEKEEDLEERLNFADKLEKEQREEAPEAGSPEDPGGLSGSDRE